MSADNWAVCPRCFDNALEHAHRRAAEVADTYGQVPAEDFIRARDALTLPTPDDFRTFREDYEVGIDAGGLVEVSYRGNCTVCDLSADVGLSKQVWPA